MESRHSPRFKRGFSLKFLALLFFSVFLAEVATDIYTPCLPALARAWGATELGIQATMGLHLLGFAMGQFLYGVLADRMGRLKALSLGVALFSISSFGCGCCKTIEMLSAFRFLQGLGACSCPVIALAMIKDRSSGERENIRLISLLTIIISASPILGPVLGILVLEGFGWRGNFLGIGFFSFLVFCFSIATVLQESAFGGSLSRQNKEKTFSRYFNFNFVFYLVVNSSLVSVVWVFISKAPFILMERFFVSFEQFAFLQSLTVLGYMGGGWIANRKVETWGGEKLWHFGVWFIALSCVSFFLFGYFELLGIFTFIFSFVLFEIGLGAARPFLVDKMMSFYQDGRGVAAAFIGTSEMLFSAFAIFFSSLYQATSFIPLVFLVGLSGAACIFLQLRMEKLIDDTL